MPKGKFCCWRIFSHPIHCGGCFGAGELRRFAVVYGQRSPGVSGGAAPIGAFRPPSSPLLAVVLSKAHDPLGRVISRFVCCAVGLFTKQGLAGGERERKSPVVMRSTLYFPAAAAAAAEKSSENFAIQPAAVAAGVAPSAATSARVATAVLVETGLRVPKSRLETESQVVDF